MTNIYADLRMPKPPFFNAKLLHRIVTAAIIIIIIIIIIKADIDRLYVKRKGGGRGLVQIEATYKAEIINIAEHLNTNYKKKRPVCTYC